MIERGFTIDLDETSVARLLGKSAARVLKSERSMATLREALGEFRELVEPAGAWRAVAVAGIEHDKLVLGDGRRIGGGPVVEVTCGATEIAAGVSTIGPHLEQRVKRWMDQGDTFHGFVLDAMASWSAGELRRQLVDRVRNHYAARGFRASIPLGPGECDWGVAGQREIFSLLDGEAAAIGVRLEPTMLMVPLKSTSFLIGAGPGPLGDEAGEPCTYCSLQATCTHRGKHGRP